ncbi:MAG: DUF1287 domain-containing protein [Marinicellaceae bacterium]
MIKFFIGFFLLIANLAVAEQHLVDAALERLNHQVVYDGSYQSIDYPNGDVDPRKGVCTDVVIRSYRSLGIDLQELVHEDMKKNFGDYPNIWGLKKPDTNIDHRRVPNLEEFFKRNGTILPVNQQANTYKPGNIVTWRLPNNLPHIGIISNIRSDKDPNRYKVIHNIGWGPKLDDMLFEFKIVGHFSYKPKVISHH